MKTIAHSVFRVRRVAIAIFAAALVPWLAGCGGGGGGSAGVGTGSAAVVVTDAPTDEFTQILLTVTKVELLGAGGQFTLFEGRRDFDLLSLRDDARLLAVGRDVPAGDWSKIRLHVEDVELIRTTLPDDLEGDEIECPEDVVPEEGFVCESIAPKIAANGKIDLNPRGPITVPAGEFVFIQLDLDALKSIHIHQTGNDRYEFRPVVFIDAFSGTVPDALVRIEGDIAQIDAAAQKIRVCGTHPVFRAQAAEDTEESSRCVDVRSGQQTSIFGADGQPVAFDALAVGDDVAALGRFRADSGESLALDAVWIHQGGFATGTAVSGEVLDGVVGDEFAIAPDADGPVQVDELVVRLLDGAVIVTRDGEVVNPSELEPGMRVRALGMLVPPSGDLDRLDASLVFVRDSIDLEQLSGTVTESFDPGDGTLVIEDTIVGPVCIAVGAGDDVFRISDQGELLQSQRIEPSQIAVGETVDVFGHSADACFDAATLVAFGIGG